jgi:uncharacterized membrane protein YphA (DoxX/SURF4 family)
MARMDLKKFPVSAILAGVLGAAFCFSGIMKMGSPASFQNAILSFQLFGYPASALIAHWLPGFELILGIGLIFRYALRIALGFSLALLACFTLLLGWIWYQGIDLNCGCFGPLDFGSSPFTAILRNCLLMALALFCFLLSPKKTRGK